MTNILPYKTHQPATAKAAFIAPNACVIGDVTLGEDSSVWYGCTVRGDVNDIKIGKRVNIQDNSIIHVATHGQGSYIGDDTTIGHGCIIHACTIGANCLIGMGAIIMDGAQIEDGTMIAAGSLVTPGKIIPAGELWAGRPARKMRALNEEDRKLISWSARHYVGLAHDHSQTLKK